MFPWRKGHVLTSMMEGYLEKVGQCLGAFQKAFETYFQTGLSADFDELVQKVHINESSCDDICRDIETALYEKALIPESRGTILTMLEKIDKVPNKCESVLFQIQSELLVIPEPFRPKFRQLVHVNCEAGLELTKAVRVLFEDLKKARVLIDELDKIESASDSLEREIIFSMFSDKQLDLAHKILLKELVLEIGHISDRCENAGDTLTIIAVKRSV